MKPQPLLYLRPIKQYECEMREPDLAPFPYWGCVWLAGGLLSVAVMGAIILVGMGWV